MKKMAIFVVLALIISLVISGETREEKNFGGEKFENSVKTYLYFGKNCPVNTLQPIVVITQPPDGAVFHTRDVTVLGYAMDEIGMNYWEWEWHWEGGSYSNSSYFETAEYVEFRIDIHGLHLGENIIIVRFRNIYGAWGEDSVTIYYEDINPPEVYIEFPSNGDVFTEPLINVEGFATDDAESGIIKLIWRVSCGNTTVEDSQTFPVAYSSVEFSIPVNLYLGENQIDVEAVDLAGNVGKDSVIVWLVEELIADANGPYYGNVNETIQFHGNATGGMPPYQWHWDFGDGSTSNQQNPTHVYSKEGNYIATLTVTDSIGNVAQDTAQVIISKNLTADANGPYYGKVNEQIQFHGSASGGKPPYQWHWDFGDGSTSNQQNPKHAYNKQGNYVAKLTVTDSEGNTADDTAQVIVYKELKAEADGPYGGKVNQAIQFHGSADGGVPPYQWHWNFGDGTFSNQQNPIHSYSQAGVYIATLTVTDSIGNVAQDTAFVYVYEEDTQAPFVEIVKPENALYINDRKTMPLPFNFSIIIGNITIEVNASDNVGVARVEFYIDNELKHVNTTYPYYWLWNEFAVGKHEIKAVAHDFAGNMAMDKQKVYIMNFG